MLPATTWVVGIGLAAVGFAIVASERVVKRTPVANRTTVVYWEKWTDAEGQAMREIVNDFNASQDRIFVQMLTISNVNDKTLLAASGGNPPDVAGLWGEQVVQFAENGAAMDMTDLGREYGLTEDKYIPVYWDVMTFNGRIFAFPTTPATTAMHVRRDLVPEHYRDPKNFPKTLEELDDFTTKCSIWTNGTDTQIGMPSPAKPGWHLKTAMFLPAEPGWWNWAWGCYFGGRLMDGEKLTLNTPENIRGFEWMAGYSKRYGPSEAQSFQSGFGTFSSPENAFMHGQVATELQGVWMANYISLFNKKLDWYAVPFPYPADRPELANTTFANFDTLVIPKGTKKVKEAFEFIAFVQRQDEMEKLCLLHAKNSPLQKCSEHFFNTHPNPYIRLFDSLARQKNAMHAPKHGAWPQISNELNAQVQAMNLGQKTAKEALNEAQERLSAALDRYKRFVKVTE